MDRREHSWRGVGVYFGWALAALFFSACASSSHSVFQHPATALVLTQWVVVNRGSPILAVFHNEDDDEWMFFADVNPEVDVQVSVALDELIKRDESLGSLSDLPPGWKATRERKSSPWVRQKLSANK
ncbi:MAG TPA: hypothetical protein VMH23_02580 [Bacteroidota bacterium]|nr:hypothetical protein [Bacteroidota bacterium]